MVVWRYGFYLRVVKTIFYQWVKYCFPHEKIKFISSSHRVILFLLYRFNAKSGKRLHQHLHYRGYGKYVTGYFLVKHSHLYNNKQISQERSKIWKGFFSQHNIHYRVYTLHRSRDKRNIFADLDKISWKSLNLKEQQDPLFFYFLISHFNFV